MDWGLTNVLDVTHLLCLNIQPFLNCGCVRALNRKALRKAAIGAQDLTVDPAAVRAGKE
jgi:hypothetical protein